MNVEDNDEACGSAGGMRGYKRTVALTEALFARANIVDQVLESTHVEPDQVDSPAG